MALAPKKHGSVQMSLHWINAICSSLLPIQIVFRFSNGPWADTMKAPDISIQLSTSGLPRVTFECGFPESHDILQDDMIDWLMGGGGAVQAVVLVKWKPCQTTMTVRGDVELYTRDTNEVLCLQQREVAPGRGEGDVFGLDIQVLRTVAAMLMANMGYAPA